MEVTLTRFSAALRSADLRVSPAETLDGLAIARLVGIEDARLLRHALSLALAKSIPDKARFDACFEMFFHQLAFRRAAKASFVRDMDPDAISKALQAELGEDARELVLNVVRGERTALAARVEGLARPAGIESMASLRDKAVVADRIANALGVPELDRLVRHDSSPLSAADQQGLRYVRSYVAEQVREYVDVQYRLRVDASGRRALIAAALAANLNQIPLDYHAAIRDAVLAMAARLRRGRRRTRKARRGTLDIKRTLRRNMAYGESLYHLVLRRRRREEATVFVVCDVSGSVASIARFLLLLVYELADVLPAVRTFAFSNRLGELTRADLGKSVEAAIESTLFDWGKGTTDYGRAWRDFRELAGTAVNHRSTVIVLGDGRNNFFDPGIADFRSIAHRAGRVLWLNPEDRDRWQEGDSEMARFATHCSRVMRLNSLVDLERVADALVDLPG